MLVDDWEAETGRRTPETGHRTQDTRTDIYQILFSHGWDQPLRDNKWPKFDSVFACKLTALLIISLQFVIAGKPNGTNSSVVTRGTRFSQLADSDPSSDETNSSSEDEMESASEGHISEEEDRKSEPYTGICCLFECTLASIVCIFNC